MREIFKSVEVKALLLLPSNFQGEMVMGKEWRIDGRKPTNCACSMHDLAPCSKVAHAALTMNCRGFAA